MLGQNDQLQILQDFSKKLSKRQNMYSLIKEKFKKLLQEITDLRTL